MKIIVSANQPYLKHLIACVNSCVKNYPQGDLIVRLINFSKKEADNFRSRYPDIDTRSIFYQDNPKRKNLLANQAFFQDAFFGAYSQKKSDFRGARWLYSDLMAKIANDRYEILLETLNKGADCVLSIDADTIIRGDLSALKEKILSHDVALHAEIVKEYQKIDFGQTIDYNSIPKLTRKEYKEKESAKDIKNYVEWHTGVMGFNNTVASKKFLKEYSACLLSPEKVHIWGAEEEEIYFAYLKNHKNIKFYNIPIMFKDEGFGTDRIVGSDQYSLDSKIWVGAGQNKYNDGLFSAEVNKYS